MLAIAVELLHGAIRAGSAEDLALTEAGDPGDWPPNPARLFGALVAADGTRDKCRVTDGSELVLIEEAPPPCIYASPNSSVLRSPVVPRYVVADKADEGTVQEYPARKSVLVRPGTRLVPLHPHVVYAWEHLHPTAEQLAALERRAARIGYLGCSDSPVRVRAELSLPRTCSADSLWEPDESGKSLVAVPFPGFVRVLDDMYDRFTRGDPTRRSWFATRMARYRSPEEVQAPPSRWSDVVWLRLDSPLPGRFLLRLTETLKAAVLDLYERSVGPVPSVLHGHGFEGTSGYQLAHWLALPEAGHEHARGRIHGVAIALPQAAPADVVAGVREVARRLEWLFVPGRPPVRISAFAGERRPWSAHPRRWTRLARRWVSVSPVVHERRAKRGPTLDDVARWCANAGVDGTPVGFRLSSVPLLRGALSMRPREVFRRAEGVRPYSHLEVLFEEPVAGPLVLGRARQFGVGLMAPVLEEGSR